MTAYCSCVHIISLKLCCFGFLTCSVQAVMDRSCHQNSQHRNQMNVRALGSFLFSSYPVCASLPKLLCYGRHRLLCSDPRLGLPSRACFCCLNLQGYITWMLWSQSLTVRTVPVLQHFAAAEICFRMPVHVFLDIHMKQAVYNVWTVLGAISPPAFAPLSRNRKNPQSSELRCQFPP